MYEFSYIVRILHPLVTEPHLRLWGPLCIYRCGGPSRGVGLVFRKILYKNKQVRQRFLALDKLKPMGPK